MKHYDNHFGENKDEKERGQNYKMFIMQRRQRHIKDHGNLKDKITSKVFRYVLSKRHNLDNSFK